MIHTLLFKPCDMPMCQFGRKACCISWNGGGTHGIDGLRGQRGYDDIKAKNGKEGMPEWKQFIHVQNKRNTDLCSGRAMNLAVTKQFLLFEGI